MQKLKDGHFELSLKQGESVILYNHVHQNELTVEPVKDQQGQTNAFGWNTRFLTQKPFLDSLFIEGR